MKALVGAFNQEKALVGAFSVIVKTDGSLAALFKLCNLTFLQISCITFLWAAWIENMSQPLQIQSRWRNTRETFCWGMSSFPFWTASRLWPGTRIPLSSKATLPRIQQMVPSDQWLKVCAGKSKDSHCVHFSLSALSWKKWLDKFLCCSFHLNGEKLLF